MPTDRNNLVVHGSDAKDIKQFFDENTAINKEGSIIGSISLARSFPIPTNLTGPEIREWQDLNWGEGVYEDAAYTTHEFFLEGKMPMVKYTFITEGYTQVDTWVEKISQKYPNLIFELDPQWDGQHSGDTWHEHGGESYVLGSGLIYVFKNGIGQMDLSSWSDS